MHSGQQNRAARYTGGSTHQIRVSSFRRLSKGRESDFSGNKGTLLALYKGRCAICGRPGSDIDHVLGSDNDISNLQLLCRECHNKKTVAGFIQIPPDDPRYTVVVQKRVELEKRINVLTPKRPCDNQLDWPTISKRIRNERKLIFFKSLVPIVNDLVEKDLILRRIAEVLNANSVPTYSGHGQWDRHMMAGFMHLMKKRAK